MLLIVVLTLYLSVALSTPTLEPDLDQQWDQWKSLYQKKYDEKEEIWRRRIWEKSLKMIEQHNLEYSMGKHSFTLGMNQFGDMTDEEYRQMSNGFMPEATNLEDQGVPVHEA